MKRILAFALCLFVFAGAVMYLSEGSTERQKETLEKALTNAITECYAEEGRYPESLEYLVENYRVTYDEERFFIDYQVRGQNIRPDVTIIEIK